MEAEAPLQIVFVPLRHASVLVRGCEAIGRSGRVVSAYFWLKSLVGKLLSSHYFMMHKKLNWRWIASGLVSLFLALALLRISSSLELDVEFHRLVELGLFWGFVGDLAFTVLVLGVGLLAISLTRWAGAAVLLLFTGLLWLANVSNVLNFKFSRTQLELWMIATQRDKLWSIRSSVLALGADGWIVASVACIVLALVLFARWTMTIEANRFKPRILTLGLLAVICGLLLRQSPTWFDFPTHWNSVTSDSIVYRWVWEFKKEGWKALEHQPGHRFSVAESSAWLDAYSQSVGEDLGSLYKGPFENRSGVTRMFSPDTNEVKALRARLGLNPDRAPNVILLFLESTRALEFLDDEIAQQVLPNLRSTIAKRGILFREAYSSAKFTVRGQFQTLCSTISSQSGPTVYEKYPFLKARCLQGLLLDSGYENYWMNPYHRFYAGKYLFESHHGTQHFMDRDEFFAHDDDERENLTEWGIADRPFYRQAFAKLEAIHAKGKPFFVHVLNTGTHHPYSREIKGVELEKELYEKTKANPDHVGYLKTVKLLDNALGEFFASFFASPMSDDTVVMIVSDHGHGLVPAYPKLDPLQKNLLTPRIIFAVVSKNMKQPDVIEYPVNQIDMAPLIATVTGATGPVTWSGRNPLNGSGTPWTLKQAGEFSYRTSNHICSKLPQERSMRCWNVKRGQDPLLNADLEATEENSELTTNFSNVVDANESLLESGSLEGEEIGPPNSTDIVTHDDVDTSASM